MMLDLYWKKSAERDVDERDVLRGLPRRYLCPAAHLSATHGISRRSSVSLRALPSVVNFESVGTIT